MLEGMAEYSQFDEEEHEKEFSDFCEQLLFRKLDDVAIYTGSFFELPLIYFFETLTDVDSVVYHRNICAIKRDEPTPKEFKGTVLIIQTEESHHGFARLYSKINNTPYERNPQLRPAYSQLLLKGSDISACFRSFLQVYSRYTQRFLANLHGLSRDVVDAIWCPNWPEEANEWKRRERRNGWPSPCTVEEIVNSGCFFVAKPHKDSQYDINEWRFSFSEAELILIYTWDHVQMYIYHILRLIKTDVVKRCGGKKKTLLSTYYFKTLMFWACEGKSKEFWLPGNIESSAKELILVMIEWLIEKQCRNYFMPGNNMLDHLSDSDNFEREAQFLIDALNSVHEYISNTVPGTEDIKHDRLNEISLRIPSKLLLTLHLIMSFFYTVDPYMPGRQRHIPSTVMHKGNIFRSCIANVFKCLTIHRFLGLAEDFDVKLDGMREVAKSIEGYFRKAYYEEHVHGFTYVNISPMDNGHTVVAKMLKQNIDCSHGEPAMSNRQEAESVDLGRSSTRSELWNCKTDRIGVACISETLLNVMNEQIEKPLCFHTAAYEANFYWTIYGDEFLNNIAVESHIRALDICTKWLYYAKSIKQRLTLKLGCGFHVIPIIISNGWSMIFDKYIQVLLGFLSLVKAVTNSRSRCNYKLSNGSTDSYVTVHVEPIDFLYYVSYQCQLHLMYNCALDNRFKLRCDIAGRFLSSAIYISTKLFEQST